VAVNNRIPQFRGTLLPRSKGTIALGTEAPYPKKKIINNSSMKTSELLGFCYWWSYLLFNVAIIRNARIKFVRGNYTFFYTRACGKLGPPNCLSVKGTELASVKWMLLVL